MGMLIAGRHCRVGSGYFDPYVVRCVPDDTPRRSIARGELCGASICKGRAGDITAETAVPPRANQQHQGGTPCASLA